MKLYFAFILDRLLLLLTDVYVICGYQLVSMGRRKFGTDFQLMFRILKALLFLGFMSVMTVLFVVWGLTVSDLFAAILAFLPTGWAILLVTFATMLSCDICFISLLNDKKYSFGH